MGRLPGFDYKKPFFNMVTLKRLQGLAAFSEIGGQGRHLAENAITAAFSAVIRGFAAKWRGLWPIETFVVMPDHIHLLLHIKDSGDQLALGKYVYQLEKALAREYWRIMGGAADGPMGRPMPDSGLAPARRQAADEPTGRLMPDSGPAGLGEFGKARPVEPVFERDWHDWIVMKGGQLEAFTRYIRENPRRAWLRRQNARYFCCVGKVSFAGRDWFAYGNTALLDLPVIEAFRCSRKWAEDGEEWRAALLRAGRIGPGGAGVGTFMSPCEKACGNAIYKSGGALIVFSPEGFGERWHPPRKKEALCAKGRMLFLSLWAAERGRPDNATLYRRCHEMGDIVAKAL